MLELVLPGVGDEDVSVLGGDTEIMGGKGYILVEGMMLVTCMNGILPIMNSNVSHGDSSKQKRNSLLLDT